MFDVYTYCKDLVVPQDDEVLQDTLKNIELYELLFDDAYLSRAYHWGVATSMENQLSYLGGNLLPGAEERHNNQFGDGITGEGDLSVDWFANEAKPHINEDRPLDQLEDDSKTFMDQIQDKMRTAGIVFVAHVRAHDEVSKDLNQLSYGAIKSRAASKRKPATRTRAKAASKKKKAA